MVGTWASVTFHEPRYDGIASLIIGLVLAAVSIILARESKGLLIGERADPALQQGIVALAAKSPELRVSMVSSRRNCRPAR